MRKKLRSALQSAGYRMEALGFLAMKRVFQALGPDRASALSGAVWRTFAPLNKRHKRADANLAAAMPFLTPEQRRIHLTTMWNNLGRTTAESFHIGALVKDRSRFEIDDATWRVIERVREQGGVFVSLHQGNWELAAPLLNALGLPIAGVYQKLQNPHVEAAARALREEHYPLGLYAKTGDAARRMLNVLSKGGALAIMADLRDRTGVMVPFFDRDAPSTIFPAFCAIARSVPLFAGAVIRTEGARFRVHVEEIGVARTGDRDADISETTRAIQAAFERFIRDEPGQWMWGHKRWER